MHNVISVGSPTPAEVSGEALATDALTNETKRPRTRGGGEGVFGRLHLVSLSSHIPRSAATSLSFRTNYSCPYPLTARDVKVGRIPRIGYKFQWSRSFQVMLLCNLWFMQHPQYSRKLRVTLVVFAFLTSRRPIAKSSYFIACQGKCEQQSDCCAGFHRKISKYFNPISHSDQLRSTKDFLLESLLSDVYSGLRASLILTLPSPCVLHLKGVTSKSLRHLIATSYKRACHLLSSVLSSHSSSNGMIPATILSSAENTYLPGAEGHEKPHADDG